MIDIDGEAIFIGYENNRSIPSGAICNQVDPDFWFSYVESDKQKAIAICSTCPVRQGCLEYAITEPVQRWGIWGGVDMSLYDLEDRECPNGNVGYYSRSDSGNAKCLCPDCTKGDA